MVKVEQIRVWLVRKGIKGVDVSAGAASRSAHQDHSRKCAARGGAAQGGVAPRLRGYRLSDTAREKEVVMPINQDILTLLPLVPKTAYSKMTEAQRAQFEREYKAKARSTGKMVLISMLFPVQHFMLGRSGLGILFFMTFLGFGVGYVVEWFLTPMRVQKYNVYMASRVITSIYYGRPMGRIADLAIIDRHTKRLLEIIYESIDLAETSKNASTRKSRIALAIEKTAEIPKMYNGNSNIYPMEYLQELRDEIHTDCVLVKVDNFINKAKLAKTPTTQIGYIEKALAEIQDGLNDPYVFRKLLLEKQAYLEALPNTIQLKNFLEQAERFEFKGYYSKAIDAYMDALFVLKKDDIPDDKQGRQISVLENKIAQLRNESNRKKKDRDDADGDDGAGCSLDSPRPKS